MSRKTQDSTVLAWKDPTPRLFQVSSRRAHAIWNGVLRGVARRPGLGVQECSCHHRKPLETPARQILYVQGKLVAAVAPEVFPSPPTTAWGLAYLVRSLSLYDPPAARSLHALFLISAGWRSGVVIRGGGAEKG